MARIIGLHELVLLHLRSGFRTTGRPRVELALVHHMHEFDADQNSARVKELLESEHRLDA